MTYKINYTVLSNHGVGKPKSYTIELNFHHHDHFNPDIKDCFLLEIRALYNPLDLMGRDIYIDSYQPIDNYNSFEPYPITFEE